MLKAGMARAEITPELGLELAGYPHYPRNNTGAHDPLYATCMYIANDYQEIAMVTLDLLFFSKKHVLEVRKKVEKECGIPASNIMISCSHTHSGPWASGRLDIESLEAGKQQPQKYVERVINTITQIIVEAKSNNFDAEFASGTAVCGAESGVGGNRRIPGGPHDPLVSVIAVKDEYDVRGVMVNYTLHPTFIHEWSNVCTADYPCYLKIEIEEQNPKAIVGFAQGASGNQSSRYYRQGESYDEAERVGRIIGKAANKVLKRLEWSDNVNISVAASEIPITLRDFGTEEELREKVAKDEAVYKELYAKYGDSENREEYYLWQNANLKLLGSEDQLGYILMQKKGIKIELLDDEAPAEVQVLKIGDTCVVGIPGEAFVEYGLYIKAVAGYKTVVINELANGCLPGYMYTPESVVTGGYETDTSMLSEDFGMKIVQTAIDLIKK